MMTWPEVGRSSRFMQRTSVDLPAPEKPMMPKTSPSWMARFTSLTAVKLSLPVLNVLVRCFNSITRIPWVPQPIRAAFCLNL